MACVFVLIALTYYNSCDILSLTYSSPDVCVMELASYGKKYVPESCDEIARKIEEKQR